MTYTKLYWTHGKLIASSNDVRVYSFEGNYFLEIGKGHVLWAISDELNEYIEQIGDKPVGDCLEIGLGMGIASKYILSRPINSLTTIEKNKDVIQVFKQLNTKIDPKHEIINADGLYFLQTTPKRYDFIFLDFYREIDEESLIDIKYSVILAKRLLKPRGQLVGWFDIFTPTDLAKEFNKLFS